MTAGRTVRIDGDRITDQDSFHDAFSETFGFPGYYGRNMNAWIDCMSCLGGGNEGMCTFDIQTGATLLLVLENAARLKARCPDLFNELIECTAIVNYRAEDPDSSVPIALAYLA